MPAQFKIAITKEIIAYCKNCGSEGRIHESEKNCAIAVALSDIFPNVYVTGYCIYPFGIDGEKEKDLRIPIPLIAQQFIKLFDGFRLTPVLRLLLPEFEFTIDIPDAVIEYINIDEVKELIKGKKNIGSLQQHLPAHY